MPSSQRTARVRSVSAIMRLAGRLMSFGLSGARVEWRDNAKAPARIFLAGNGKLWFRAPGGDVELSTYTGAEKSAVAALLASDAKAAYKKDAKGPVSIAIGGYTLTRSSLSTSKADASNFAVRPRKLSLASLLGPSQSTVSATAGGRGVGTKGLKLADGGDYAAVESLENRDAGWAEKLGDALTQFQKEGKVGKERDE